MQPPVSVIIPNFNRAELLEQAIASALAQTLAPKEVLVCDDGSTDNSRDVVAGFQDARVRWLAGEHTGLPAVARNRGIHASSGDWLAFLDNDDAWLPNKLALQLAAVQATGCQAVCSNAVRVDRDGRDIGLYFSMPDRLLTFKRLLLVNEVICSSALVQRSLVLSVGGFPEFPELRSVVDYSLWLRIATITTFAYQSDTLLSYRDVPSDSMRKGDCSYWEQRRLVFDDLMTWLEQDRSAANCRAQVRRRQLIDRVLCVKSYLYQLLTGGGKV